MRASLFWYGLLSVPTSAQIVPLVAREERASDAVLIQGFAGFSHGQSISGNLPKYSQAQRPPQCSCGYSVVAAVAKCSGARVGFIAGLQ